MGWLNPFRRRPESAETDEEIDSHLRLAEQDRMNRGTTPAEARRQARIEIGGADRVKLQVREADSAVWFLWPGRVAREARDALRALRRTPAMALTSAGLIALVIGGNTTIFSMIYAILSKPARGVSASGLVTLESRRNGASIGPAHSYPDYQDYVSASTTVRPLLAYVFQRFTIAVPDGSYGFAGGLVSRNYFDALGVHLVRGRSFTEQEEQLQNSGLVAVIGYQIWQDYFRGADDVVGRGVRLNGHPATIVGVAPQGFQGPWLGGASSIWVPLLAYERLQPPDGLLSDRASGPLLSIGQLAPGVSLGEAQAEFSTISARLEREHPDTNRGRTVRLVPYSVTAGGDSLVAEHGWQFLGVFSIVTLLTVLIVCANVANLMLARAAIRQREMAVRRSLGASRVSIVRVLLIEGLFISLLAWGVSCLMAVWTSKLVPRWITPPAGAGTPLPVDFTPDWRVITYAMLLALASTLAFTLPPAIRAWRQEVLPGLRDGEHSIVPGRTRLSSGLVIVQLAFAVLLLTSAGLGYRSTSLLGSRDLGFEKEQLLLTTINTSDSAASADANLALLERVRERLRAVPGVQAVSYTRSIPSRFWSREAIRRMAGEEPLDAEAGTVGPDYLAALGLAPIAGRELGNDETQPGQAGAVINENLAKALFPDQPPVGRTLLVGRDRREVTVVGISPNALFSGFSRTTRPNFLLLAQGRQSSAPGEITLYIRHRGSADAMAPVIGAALRNVDVRVPVVYMRTMDSELDTTIWPVRLISLLLVVFAVISFTIAAIGQYAVIAFEMRRRTRDFGVRMALGASARQIVVSVLREGSRWTIVGLAAGFALSLAAGRAAQGLLFGVTSTDTPTYVSVCALLTAASLLACYLPARRAARIDPMKALRHE